MASNLWHTPIPYLFAGLGVVMILIAVALVILACSNRKSSSHHRDSESSSLPENSVIVPLDMEPRFAVIMPGDDRPTYIANPLFSVVDIHRVLSVEPPALNQEP